MSISAVGSSPAMTAPVALPRDNEAAEKVPDNEATEASSSRSALKEGLGNKIDVSV